MPSAISSQAINKNTLSGEITDVLRDAIITGELKQGSRLSETKLADEFNVSRGPLREAIRRLEGMNLIHHVPQHGARVVRLGTNFVMELYHAREALESKAAAQAAVNMSSKDIDNLHRAIDSQSRRYKESASASIPAESDYAFHELLIKGSKNRVLEHLLLHEAYSLIKMFRYQNEIISASSNNSLTEHRQLVYAIEQRDEVLAEVTMRQHIVNARKRIQRRIIKLESVERSTKNKDMEIKI